MASSPSLTSVLKGLLDEPWSEFVRREKDPSHTSSEAVIFSLIRACQKRKLPAIKESLDRVDGKVALKVEVEYPKFYFRYPYATEVDPTPKELPVPEEPATPADEEAEDEANTESLRYLLNKMSSKPRALVRIVLDAAEKVDLSLSYGNDIPEQDPKVKSVIVAGLLDMAHNGSMNAVFEVLDQIDGKVAEKVRLIGDDIYLTRRDTIAPAGAYKNKDGIYEIAADNTTNIWAAALQRENSNGTSRRLDR